MSDRFAIPAEKMRQILEVSRLLAVTANLDVLLDEIARATRRLLDAERASIFLYDPATDELWTKVALDAAPIRVPSHAGIVGSVFHSKKLLNTPDAYADPRFNREVDRRTGFTTRNLLTAPMFDLAGKTVGVIQAVNKIGHAFGEEDEQAIALLTAQGGVAIQRYYLQVDAIQVVELRREMELAKGVQESVLPKHPPAVKGLIAEGWTRPASVTGGDCYDLWAANPTTMGIFVGDAAGHGLAPALEVLQARTLARGLSEINGDPGWVLSHMNRRMVGDLKLGHFVTVFLGFLTSDGQLIWSSAGHGPLLYRRTRSSPIQTLEPPAPPIGADDTFPTDSTTPVELQPGGSLIVMSDGIYESMRDDELFGIERVLEQLELHRDDPPALQVQHIRQALREWQGRLEPIDDQSIVIVQRV